MRLRARLAGLVTLASLLAPSLYAQDLRSVAEPRFPEACAVLSARHSAPRGTLSEASEAAPDTARIQAAIDGCASGQAVKLTSAGEKNVFLTGPLQLRPRVILWIDAGTAVFGSRDARDYDVEPGSCGIVTEPAARGRGCKPLILAENAPGSGVMGDGAIDGRGGAVLLGQDVTWWDLAKKRRFRPATELPRLLVVRRSNDCAVPDHARNSPNFHVVAERTDGFTAWGVKIRTPKTARNSDGIDPSSSNNVTIAHCHIDTGDDNVAIKAGDSGPATHMTIAHNHFYAGHGMSIGSGTSGGVSAIRVSDLTIDGADNGLRIKSDRSRGGLVEDVAYESVCMRNVANPIVLTTMYTNFGGEKPPVYRDIVLKDVHSVTPGSSTLLGLDAARPLEVRLDNVFLDGLRPGDLRAGQARVRIGPRRGSLVPSGEGSLRRHRATAGARSAARTGSSRSRSGRAPAAAVRCRPRTRHSTWPPTGPGVLLIQRAIDVAAEGVIRWRPASIASG
jgi:polygalacturonase